MPGEESVEDPGGPAVDGDLSLEGVGDVLVLSEGLVMGLH